MNINELRQLHPLEIKTLFTFENDEQLSTDSLTKKSDMVMGQANQAISWLLQKSLIKEIDRIFMVMFEITDLGEKWRTQGTPAERLIKTVEESPCTLVEATKKIGLEQKDIGSAYGVLARYGVLDMDAEKRLFIKDATLPAEIQILNTFLQKETEIIESEISEEEKKVINQYAKKRGSGSEPFRKVERELVHYSFTEAGIIVKEEVQKLGLTGEELSTLTPQMLKDQSWKNRSFRAYNISLPPNRVSIGRRNSYADFLQQIKDKLVSLGFEECEDPLVATEFWNSDALFMPQFHAARNIHDVYYLKNPTHAKEIEEPWLSQVAAVHENGGDTGSRGWQYSFDRDFTKRLILRSQGTVMSAKALTRAQVPGKYFGVLRVFRNDQVDATHLSDFYQTEGIILGEDVNVCTLLGLLKVFAEEFAHAEEVKYVPGYFPFTEPSIEVHIKHPQIGWMELGGSGILRPEVTRALGIDVPVAAWGIGIDRMATMQMGINDIRDLFSNDLEKVSLRKGVQV